MATFTATVRLTQSEGGDTLTVTNITTYVRATEAQPGPNYRDSFIDHLSSAAGSLSTVPDGVATVGGAAKTYVSDEVSHTAPRAQSALRKFHLFSDAAEAVVGFFWDEFVVSVVLTEDPV